MTQPADVLDFWFGPPPLQTRDAWFRKSDAFDAEVRERFGATLEAALAGGVDGWAGTPRGALAAVIVLDQFTRNAFRDTPRAFAGDARALALARRLAYTAQDRTLAPLERWFAYMPFEHSESLVDQYESVRLFRALAEAGLAEPLPWAERHLDVVRRFGRFPHRNALLGRVSTPEELAFLQQPGSRF
jgi:uncharacterized protein (DUF924 family)